jgi:hypothetical protein
MGEARRRRRLENKDLARVKSMPRGQLPPEMIADFFKGIAWQLGGLEFRGLLDGPGGLCVFKTLAAYQAIRASSIDASISIGGLLARVGPDPWRDVVAFCGPRNMGFIFPNGTAAFHSWVRYGKWIFDPSVGEWRNLDSVAAERAAFDDPTKVLDPPQWTIELPQWWLKSGDEVELAWRPEGTPELGEAWYAPFYGDVEIIMNRMRAVHEDVGKQIAGALAGIYNDYCERNGLDSSHDDTVYPLKFVSLAVGADAARGR